MLIHCCVFLSYLSRCEHFRALLNETDEDAIEIHQFSFLLVGQVAYIYTLHINKTHDQMIQT